MRQESADILCATCGSPNRAGRRFCGSCGAALVRRCPACDGAAQGGDRFCGECGHPLAPAAPPAPGRDGGGTDTTGADHPASARGRPAPPAALPDGERRPLTVFFCDLVGSTDLAARLDPEDYREVVSRYLAHAETLVGRFGGYVAQHLGDGLLVYFGWPNAWEDGPVRAVRAGLALVDAVAAGGGGFAMKVRVGIDTGVVVVSAIGRGARNETLAVGETPNVAARIQAVADPNTVVISPATHALIAGLFVVEECGAHRLKGLPEPMRLYRVVQPSGIRSRLDLAAGNLTPLVGRLPETGTLLEAWERAGEGSGQAVLVTGEAGIGKSRLIYALRERLRDQPHTWLETACTPYLQGTALQPVIELLTQGPFFHAGDTPAARLAALEQAIRRAGVADADALALMAQLLGIPGAPDAAIEGMSPERKRARMLDVLVDWTLRLAALQPLVLVMEDLHWCDASSLELLGRLLEPSATAAMLVIATTRPEFTPPWPARSNCTALTLTGLTRRQARALIDSMHRGLPPALVELLVERAGGVPLHLEELVRMVRESGLLRERDGHYELTGAPEALAIPPTLHESLLARLDRLSSAKAVAQRAAVLGREFDYALVAETCGLPEPALREGLARLVDADLVYVRGEPPSARYTFKHALVQDAAYGSLLRRARQELHGRVVDVLLSRGSDAGVSRPEVVARHAEAADRVDEAIAFYQQAAEEAERRSAHREAGAHLQRAIALVPKTPATGRAALEGRLHMRRGDCLLVTSGYAHGETSDAYAQAVRLLSGTDDRLMLGRAQNGLAVCRYTSGEVACGRDLAVQALEMAEASGDETGAVSAMASVMFIEWVEGALRSSLASGDRCIQRWSPHDRRLLTTSGADDLVAIMSVAGVDLWLLGYPDQGLGRVRDAVARARRLEHPPTIAFALAWEALMHGLRRDAHAQGRVAGDVIAVSETYGLSFWGGVGRMFAGAARACPEEPAALAEVFDGLALAGETGSRAAEPMFLALVAEAQQRAGRHDDAAATVALALASAADTGQPFWDADLHRLDGELNLARGGDPDVAEASLRRALEIAAAQEARSFELRAATALARLRADRGDPGDGGGLQPIHGWFSEGHGTGDLVAAAEVLDELRRAR